MHGLESTIVAVRDRRLVLLRHGPIASEVLREVAPVELGSAGARPEAPGQLPSHYAPRTPLVLTQYLRTFALPQDVRCGALAWSGCVPPGFVAGRTLSASADLREGATNLFRYLRELDDAGLDLLVAEEVPETGLGAAIMDRLRRAAAK